MHRTVRAFVAAAVAASVSTAIVSLSAPARAAETSVSAAIPYQCHVGIAGLDLDWNQIAVTVSTSAPDSVTPGEALPARPVTLDLTVAAEIAAAFHDLVRVRSLTATTTNADLTWRSNGYNTTVPVGAAAGSVELASAAAVNLKLQGTAPASTVAATASDRLAVLAPAAFTALGTFTRSNGTTGDFSFDCRAATQSADVPMWETPTVPVDRTIATVAVVGGTADPGTDPQDPTFTVPPTTPPPPTTPVPTTTPTPTEPPPTPSGDSIPPGERWVQRSFTYQCHVVANGLDLEWVPVEVAVGTSVPPTVAPGTAQPIRPIWLTLAPGAELRAALHNTIRGRSVDGTSSDAALTLRSNGVDLAVPAGTLVGGQVAVTETPWSLALVGRSRAVTLDERTSGSLAVLAPSMFSVAGNLTRSTGTVADVSFDCRAADFSSSDQGVPTGLFDRTVATVSVVDDDPTEPPVTTPTTFHTPTAPTVPTLVPTTVPTTVPTNHAPQAPKSVSVSTRRNLPVPFVIAATDRDRDWLTFTATGVNAKAGTVVNLGPVFLFWPAWQWTGTTQFTVKVTDGRGGAATTAVKVTVKK